ncbi:hypothetical protein [Streptantibioticus ferralitis]|uniref:Uncharacterized protein n=1 Tax=Streptantibioticus ferralitis TaxID=236510 RepID=A0ABT5ZAN0_9ACTN|nr:hypothetical protein [Streptantibioticus ferralitis]MDF2260907.1 hypothetical protein [Streptantibioticus ferralitis]
MAYDRQIAIAHSATAQLTALGAEPRVITEDGSIRIEATVTADLIRHWSSLLTILYMGSDFGLADTEDGQIAWLRVELGDGTHP